MTDTKTATTSIRPLTAEDFPTVKKITESRFGKKYVQYDEYMSWLEYPGLGLALEADGEFAGYVSLLISSPEKVASHMDLPLAEVETAAAGKPLIQCRSAALFEEFEGRGYMRQLWLEVMKKAAATGAKAAFCPAWKYRDFIPMDRLLRSLGYQFLCEKEMLWYDDKEHVCRICNGPCKCTAVIYRYDF